MTKKKDFAVWAQSVSQDLQGLAENLNILHARLLALEKARKSFETKVLQVNDWEQAQAAITEMEKEDWFCKACHEGGDDFHKTVSLVFQRRRE